MKMLEQQFRVDYQYPVYFTEHLFEEQESVLLNFLNPDTSFRRKLLFVLDEGMAVHHPLLKQTIGTWLRRAPDGAFSAFFLDLPGGEQIKNEASFLNKVLSAINEHGIDRHSLIIGIGGGALLDVAGYAAAIAHRGVRHIRIPTTVLSQNDSGIGVKNGVNHFGKKNFLGSFSPPAAVFNDTAFLTTLDDRQWRSGMAEAVKVALIRDAGFFEWLEKNVAKLVSRDMEAMRYLVFHCARLHLQHIASGDPFESGSSRPLDFGHWSAHKLEQLSAFALAHGEAVAIGIGLDVLYSERIGWLDSGETLRILNLLKNMGFDLYHPRLEDPSLIGGLHEFREHLGGRLTIMMLQSIGNGENIHQMEEETIHSCVAELRALAQSDPKKKSMTEHL